MSEERRSERAVSRNQLTQEDEMAEEKEAPRKISRKEFVKGAAIGAAGAAAVGGLAACAPAATPAPTTAPTTAPQATATTAPAAAPAPGPEQWDYETDVVVAGASVGGLVAALRAAEQGANVILIEAAAETGGTGLFSGGVIHLSGVGGDWEAMKQKMPTIDPVLGKALCDIWPEATDWIRNLGVPISPASIMTGPGAQYDYAMGTGTGDLTAVFRGPYEDKRAYCDAFNELITSAGGTILTRTAAVKLWQDPDGVIIGLRAIGENGQIDIKAEATILACGGFQANKGLRAAYYGEWADLAVCRAVPYNTGAALMMGLEVGAMLSGGFGKGYGHSQIYPTIVPQSPEAYEEFDKTLLRLLMGAAQGQDRAGIFVNLEGNRFFDEAFPDTNVLNFEFMKQPYARVFLIFDEAHTTDDARTDMQLITDNGGVVLKVDTLDELIDAMNAQYGVRKSNLAKTIETYNQAVAEGEEAAAALEVTRSGFLNSIVEPPFYCIACTAGISMSYGGLRINTKAEVLNTALKSIAGLYAIPGAAGGISFVGYIGGLGQLTGFGYIAGTVAGEYATS